MTDFNHEFETAEYNLVKWERLATLISLPIFLLSIFFTASGLYDAKLEVSAGNLNGFLTASMTALVSGAILAAANFMLFGMALFAKTGEYKKIIALTLVIMPIVFGVSTINALYATNGARSLSLDMIESTQARRHYVAHIMRDTANATTLKSVIMPLQSSLQNLSDTERYSGLLSGSAGAGTIVAALSSASEGLGIISETLDQTASKTRDRRDQANVILAEMEEIISDASIGIFERKKLFQHQDRALDMIIEEVLSENVSKRIITQLDMIESTITAVGSNNNRFGRKQRAQVQALKTALAGVSAKIKPLLHHNGDTLIKPRPLLSMNEAIAEYWTDNIPGSIVAIACDTFSLWLIAFLITAKSMARRRFQEAQNRHTLPRNY